MAQRADTSLMDGGEVASYRDDILLLVARIIVGAIFLIAGLAKVGSTGAFADAVRDFHMMPDSLVVPFAFFIPWLEVLVALYLLAGFLTRIGALGAGLMLIAFIVALADSLFTGNIYHPCGCFGGSSNPVLDFLAGGNTVGWWDVIRDLILLALSVLVLLRGPGSISIDGLIAQRREVDE